MALKKIPRKFLPNKKSPRQRHFAESREMGEMIADVMDTVGHDGVVTTEQSQTLGLLQRDRRGMNFGQRFHLASMMTDVEEQTRNPREPGYPHHG